jgi:hypothetical protein
VVPLALLYRRIMMSVMQTHLHPISC